MKDYARLWKQIVAFFSFVRELDKTKDPSIDFERRNKSVLTTSSNGLGGFAVDGSGVRAEIVRIVVVVAVAIPPSVPAAAVEAAQHRIRPRRFGCKG